MNSNDLDVQLRQSRLSWNRNKPDIEQRRADLARLSKALRARHDDLIAAVAEDFGHRPLAETMLGDLILIHEEIKYMRANIRSWSKRQPIATGWKYWPAQAWVQHRPVGVVGIVGPWNYPLNLNLIAMVAALAAGNHVMMKPSEYTPATNELLADILAGIFPKDKVALVTGGPDVSAAFTQLPFDHLIFTGATEIGRKVMAAAAQNLTPVTLELGGKSPAIVMNEKAIRTYAGEILTGKLFNAGQTCIGVDYVMVPPGCGELMVSELKATASKAYPDFSSNQDYCSIIHQRHYDRQLDLLGEAARHGAKIEPLFNTPHDASRRRVTPAAVLNPSFDLRLMQEEIFGPILPVIEIEDLDSAINFINERPRPLSAYLFGASGAECEKVLASVNAGGFAINDALLQFPQHGLPFGGNGESGIGQYHGWYGFERFSKLQPVYKQSRLSGSRLFRPPFGPLKKKLMRWLA